MVSAHAVIFQYLVPSLAALLYVGMAASPTRAVWRTRKRSDIGDFNPLPAVVLVVNTTLWNGYGVITKDPFLAFRMSFGLLIAIFNTVILIGQARQKTRDRLLALLLVYLCVPLVLLALCTLAGLSTNTQKLKLVRVLEQGEYLIPTLTYYVGITFNLVCLWLCWHYPRRAEAEAVDSELAAGAPAAEAVLAATYVGSATASLGRPTPIYTTAVEEEEEPAAPEDVAVPLSGPSPGESVPTHRGRGSQRPAPPEGLGRLSSSEVRLHAAEGGRSGLVTAGQGSAFDAEPATPVAAHADKAAGGTGST